MSRRSKIEALPGPVKQAVDALLKTGRYTLDDIVQHIRRLGAEHQVPAQELPGRSAVGVYMQRFEATARRLREAREIAGTWVEKLGHEPEGKLGRLLIDMLRTVAFQQLQRLTEGDEAMDDAEARIMLLARGIKDLGIADRNSVERELKIRLSERERLAKQLDGLEAEGATGKRKLDADTLRQVREIYGIAG